MQKLIDEIRLHKGNTIPFLADDMKAKCECRSFEMSFNALMWRGHIKYAETATLGEPTFITTIK